MESLYRKIVIKMYAHNAIYRQYRNQHLESCYHIYGKFYSPYNFYLREIFLGFLFVWPETSPNYYFGSMRQCIIILDRNIRERTITKIGNKTRKHKLSTLKNCKNSAKYLKNLWKVIIKYGWVVDISLLMKGLNGNIIHTDIIQSKHIPCDISAFWKIIF